MKNIISLFMIIYSFQASSSILSIYGEDNREELLQSLVGSKMVNVPSLIHEKFLSEDGENFEINFKASRPNFNFCPSARFSNQKRIAHCSGVLISPNKILTAGHCFNEYNECKNTKFVFGWYKTIQNETPSHFNKSSVYSCKKILVSRFIDSYLSRPGAIDYAIVELERDVKSVKPSSIDIESSARIGDEVFTVGNTSGWPQKVASDYILDSHKNLIETQLDISGGNSGGPVFNASTNEVIAINHSGVNDTFFHLDTEQKCLSEGPFRYQKIETNLSRINKRRKEFQLLSNVFSFKLSAIPELKWTNNDWASQDLFEAQAFKRLRASIEQGLSTPDVFNPMTGETLLINAIIRNDLVLFRFLLSSGANPDLTTSKQESPVEIAHRLGRNDMLTELIEKKADTNLLLYNAILKKDIRLIEFLSEYDKKIGDKICDYCLRYSSFKDFAKQRAADRISRAIYKIIKN